ncbi:cyclin-like protein [Crucibulum laeve]|uniref:Cyclin-like protein n=1 Tax=Crucibulum laeve TaxID=68775 RepID=A0A5C3LFN0_9AGAR|nr:cyclin-like protein [Crucibulum laeve]
MESTLRSRLSDSESLLYDTNYAEEYAEEIYEYMAQLSEEFKPDPHYILHQKSLRWGDRRELIDWMIDIDWRINTNKQPETIWLAVNLVDRFLSVNWNISEDKLDLIGLSALLVASKFQELIPPSVSLLAHMADWEFSSSQIKHAERKLLDKLDFRISPYSSPHSWMTRIWKAATVKEEREVALSMFLIEFSLLDHRFLPMMPAKIAAVGIYTARMMLNCFWDQSFVEYSGFTSEELSLGYRMLIEQLRDSDTPCLDVYAKYADEAHLGASRFAYNWGNSQSVEEISAAERIEYVEEEASSGGREKAGGDSGLESE